MLRTGNIKIIFIKAKRRIAKFSAFFCCDIKIKCKKVLKCCFFSLCVI